jgi:hypothetical protein
MKPQMVFAQRLRRGACVHNSARTTFLPGRAAFTDVSAPRKVYGHSEKGTASLDYRYHVITLRREYRSTLLHLAQITV